MSVGESWFTKTVRAWIPEGDTECFIDFDSLKQKAHVIVTTSVSGGFYESFQALLDREVEKVNMYALVQHEYISRCLKDIINQTGSTPSGISDHSHRDLLIELQSISTQITQLDFYVRHNYEGLTKLARIYDKMTTSSSSIWFTSHLEKQPFILISFEDLLALLSVAYSRLRRTSSSEAEWIPPTSFVRSTAKYWIRPEMVIRLKTLILEFVPLLIYGMSEKENEILVTDPFASSGFSSNQLISSVYFDSSTAVSYHDRINRREGARLVRFRWYGRNDGNSDKEIFLERKIHHESWTGIDSVKERLVLSQGEVAGFLRSEGEPPITAPLFSEAKSMIRSLELRPTIRTCYYRTAFQSPTSNAVRISLDSQLTFINECDESSRETSWCRVASEILSKNDVEKFPYAVLEIKLQDAISFPDWVADVLEKVGAIQVHKFSKFIHGMAALHAERLKVFPHWMGECEYEAAHDPSVWNDRLDPEAGSEGSIESPTFPKLRMSSSGDPLTLLDMPLVEPKSIFANERTFLHYLLRGLYLLAFSGFNGGDKFSKNSLRIAIGFYSVWCFWVFFNRLKSIQSTQAVEKSIDRLYSSYGPYVLYFLFCFSMVLFR